MNSFKDYNYCNNYKINSQNKQENKKDRINYEKNYISNSFESTSESDGKINLGEDSESLNDIIKKSLVNISNNIGNEDNLCFDAFYHCNYVDGKSCEIFCNNILKDFFLDDFKQ